MRKNLTEKNWMPVISQKIFKMSINWEEEYEYFITCQNDF